ncbi:class II fructose-bisphosphate aldolase [Nocardia abscessus]|uniref:class II fructose-bisphosphate aldolase n=1 Tax=Nocardia abscessus TaxID=120957 RepID=UPI002457A96E|nr:class II fructose-bisphosphate aldolase [Nocardia abscessus]
MTGHARTATELFGMLRSDQALCAFNVENFDTLKPAMTAAGEMKCPVIIAWTVPAARYLGYEVTAHLVGALAEEFGVEYALHLDHCESDEEIRRAVDAGFTSANFLDEGAIAPGSYLPAAQALRSELGAEVSLEFVLGQLGHIEDGHGHGHGAGSGVAAAEVAAFADSCKPDIVGFDCGSLHGMRSRAQDIDVELIEQVSKATGLPIVLHGSSGVREEILQKGIDAGIRKVNIETAIRTAYLHTVRAEVTGDGAAARKPRYLTKATDAALHETYIAFLRSYTLRTR